MGKMLELRGGRVMDPCSGRDEYADIHIENGILLPYGSVPASEGVSVDKSRKAVSGSSRSAVSGSSRSAAGGSTEILDISGCLVLPGLIDFHAHAAGTVIPLAVKPDEAGVDTGVSAVCDAGSCGWLNFDAFHEYVIPQAVTKVFALLHLSPFGEAVLPEVGYSLFDQSRILDVIERYRDVIRGIKMRYIAETITDRDFDVLEHAVLIARTSGLPLVVHTGFADRKGISDRDLRAAGERLLKVLEKGDVITHCFTGKPGGIVADMSLRPALEDAVSRGVQLDAAPGRSHMNFSTARRALVEGIFPDLIGTDVVRISPTDPLRKAYQAHFYNIAMVMNKLTALGMPLEKTAATATCNPAAVLGTGSTAGRIVPGLPADLTVLDMVEGDFLLSDGADGNLAETGMVLVPRMVIQAGCVREVSETIRSGIPYRELMLQLMDNGGGNLHGHVTVLEKGQNKESYRNGS